MTQARQHPSGRPRRLDAMDKVTGRARYTSDLALPGMLHGVIVRSNRPHARLLAVDISAAQAVPGVEAIATVADAPGMFGEVIKDQRVFARDRVRYIGEPIAAVAATSVQIARVAAELIQIEYEDLEPIFDPEDALRDGAPLLHEEYRDYATPGALMRSGNVCSRVTITTGDVEEAFRQAAHVFEDAYAAHSVHHAPAGRRFWRQARSQRGDVRRGTGTQGSPACQDRQHARGGPIVRQSTAPH